MASPWRRTNAARRGKASLGRHAGTARKFFPRARPALFVPSLRTQRDGIRISSQRGDSGPLLARTLAVEFAAHYIYFSSASIGTQATEVGYGSRNQ
jgi:hypothetical protein